MALLLRLRKDGEDNSITDHPFEQGVVGIGRDPANALQLARLSVSKKHARIDQREGGLFLTDLRSHNGTFLNGVRLVPETPHPIDVGDSVRICDYIVEVAEWERPTLPPAAAPDFVVPREVSGTSQALPAVESPVSPRAEESLSPLASADRSDARNYKELLEETRGECQELKAELALLTQALAEARANPPPIGESRLTAEENSAYRTSFGQVSEPVAVTRLRAVLDAVLQPVLNIMRGRNLFRSEFMGATMYRDPALETLSKLGSKEWIEFFLDSDLTEDKVRERLEALRIETSEVIPHVIGLLDGYRKSVDVGAKNMLQQMNPVRAREELFKRPLQIGPLSIPLRFLPLVAERIVWNAIVQRHHELEEEDRGILEQRFFRPGFIQGYTSCITFAKHATLPSRPRTSMSTKVDP